MRLRRPVLLSSFALVAFVTGCGTSAKTFDVKSVSVRHRGPMPERQQHFVNAVEAGRELAKLRARALAFAVGSVKATEQPPSVVPVEPRSAPPGVSGQVAAEPTSSIDWDCVAVAETGADFGMHGSSYSSAYGVMNQAVRENAPPDVAARILAGSASKPEQLAMAQSIAARHGIDAWAASTVAKCAR